MLKFLVSRSKKTGPVILTDVLTYDLNDDLKQHCVSSRLAWSTELGKLTLVTSKDEERNGLVAQHGGDACE